jgi:hypothetical protein
MVKKIFYMVGAIIIGLTLFFSIIALTGCSKKTPVEESFTGIQTSIVQLKEELPPECRTDAILQRIDKIELKRQTAEQVCQAKIKDTQIKYERVLWVLGVLVLGLFVKIFIKK